MGVTLEDPIECLRVRLCGTAVGNTFPTASAEPVDSVVKVCPGYAGSVLRGAKEEDKRIVLEFSNDALAALRKRSELLMCVQVPADGLLR
jgi:hypothetical protein